MIAVGRLTTAKDYPTPCTPSPPRKASRAPRHRRRWGTRDPQPNLLGLAFSTCPLPSAIARTHSLRQAARCFLSVWEGFGLALLESLAIGTPAIV
jgi:hypothetical protein